MLLFVAPTVLKVFRVPNPDNYSAKYIFVKVWNIINCVTTWISRVISDYPNNNPFEHDEYPLDLGETDWINSNAVYDL